MRQPNFVALGDVAEVTAGGGAPQEDKFFTEEGFPFIRAGSLIKLLNNEGESSLEQINEDNAKIHGLKLYPKDSVLFAKSGMSATKGHVYRTKQPCYVVNHLAVIIPNMLCDASYIEKVLKKYPPVSLIQDPAYPSIRLSDIAKLKIPLPPLAEQKRIAAVLDKAAEIKVNRELAIEKLESFIASLFDAMQLAENFETKSTIRDLTKKASLTPITDKSVWSLSLEQIDANTGNINDCVMVDISELGSSTYFFSPPVVLYSKLRPYLNKVALPESNGFATTELVPLYCDEKKVLPEYLATYLRSSKFVEFANTNSAGAKMPRVMMDKFWGHQISLPNIAKQLKFVEAYKQCKKQMQVHEEAAKALDKLMASLQHQAFTTGFAE